MGGIAILARQLGLKVTGSDANVYPPMSTQLEQQGIELMQGYQSAHLEPRPDLVVVGNAMSRGNEAVEYMLEQGLPYTSGPAFLRDHVLQGRWVLAVSGTHGKTTTSGMLAWILERAGLNPGFLVGGVPQNFGLSARLGDSPFFVVEADEYDSAFFDKRSKFIHYRPNTLIINNIEFDHGDIFDNLDAIKKQFHHLVRTVPRNGLIVEPAFDANVQDVLAMGCWTPRLSFGSGEADWQCQPVSADCSRFTFSEGGRVLGEVNWDLIGEHNMHNAIAAVMAARHAGVDVAQACAALAEFRNVKRRMEIRGIVQGVTIYDDFAHHPTAIRTTLDGLRRKVGDARIVAVLEPRSNTMRMGVHKEALAQSLAAADYVLMLQPPDIEWRLEDIAGQINKPVGIFDDVEGIVEEILKIRQSGDHVLIMSNGAFGGIHEKLLQRLA